MRWEPTQNLKKWRKIYRPIFSFSFKYRSADPVKMLMDTTPQRFLLIPIRCLQKRAVDSEKNYNFCPMRSWQPSFLFIDIISLASVLTCIVDEKETKNHVLKLCLKCYLHCLLSNWINAFLKKESSKFNINKLHLLPWLLIVAYPCCGSNVTPVYN